jgi:PAS domain-containing protein
MFSRARHPIFVLDPDGDAVRYANRCACLLLGYDVGELLALPASAVFWADGGALEAFLDAIVKRGDGWTTRVGLRAKPGALLPAELLALPFRSDGQRYVLVLANTRRPHRGRLV